MSSEKHQGIEDGGGKKAEPKPTAEEHPQRHNPLLEGQLGCRSLSGGPNPKAPELIRCLCLTSHFPMGLAFCLYVHPKLLLWGQADPCSVEGCVPAGAGLVEPALHAPAGPSPHLSLHLPSSLQGSGCFFSLLLITQPNG